MDFNAILQAVISFLFATVNEQTQNQQTSNTFDQVIEAAPPTGGLIPRRLLLGNAEKVNVRLSPDGRQIAYLGPLNGVMNLWVQKLDGGTDARAVTNDRGRGIMTNTWTFQPGVLSYSQDTNGDENFLGYIVDTNKATPIIKATVGKKGATVRGIASSYKYPNIMIYGINDRDPRFHDLYRYDYSTGSMELLLKNTGFGGFNFDNDLELRLANRQNSEAGTDYFRPVTGADGILQWQLYKRTPFEDEYGTMLVGFDKTNTKAYWLSSEGRNFNALYEADFEQKDQKRIIFEGNNRRGDITAVQMHPTEFRPIAVLENYDKPRYWIIDNSIRSDMDYLKNLEPEGQPIIVDMSLDFNRWLIVWVRSDAPRKYYIYNRPQRQVKYLFSGNKALGRYKHAKTTPVQVKTRDFYNQLCYLTIPTQFATPEFTAGSLSSQQTVTAGKWSIQPIPLVLDVHGGPWARDEWGFRTDVSLFADRGYAVMQCNFRSSTGLGKEWTDIGNGEWGRKMHYDLLDAVDWAIAQRIAQPDKVAMFGISYGGYAVLAALTQTPQKFACGVDFVGPSNLETILVGIPPYWTSMRTSLIKRVGGDPGTPQGRQFLRSRSPLYKANQIRKPLLIAQGANDVRVRRNESDSIAQAMKRANIPVTFVIFPNEGHMFVRPENRLAIFGITEQFLAKCLGGQAEPIANDIRASSAQIIDRGDLNLPN